MREPHVPNQVLIAHLWIAPIIDEQEIVITVDREDILG